MICVKKFIFLYRYQPEKISTNHYCGFSFRLQYNGPEDSNFMVIPSLVLLLLQTLVYRGGFFCPFFSFSNNQNLTTIVEFDDAFARLDIIYELVAELSIHNVGCKNLVTYVEIKFHYIRSNRTKRFILSAMFNAWKFASWRTGFLTGFMCIFVLWKWLRHIKLGRRRCLIQRTHSRCSLKTYQCRCKPYSYVSTSSWFFL